MDQIANTFLNIFIVFNLLKCIDFGNLNYKHGSNGK